MKRIFVFSTLCLMFVMAHAQVLSPEQYLGYKIGQRYSPHFKVVGYFRQVADANPAMVKMEQYGETNEGRPLYITFVSTPENIANLEKIRLNSLRMAGQSPDKSAPTEQTPAIVWLSYNVHGNETSSSEAAMLTLWELVNPANTASKEWLKNTLVIMDPCINPDGRDRYVNWFNSVVGAKANALPFTREHIEPWPGGRPNHYYFDLNRDWAWQTQLETQQRLIKYNQWLPQVHVDFHEQGYNEPYYFAPAAEPYHEVITGWQREFQELIGRNNARYFDKNGWLFFTKERFDLFYPSYGDTYPVYKGAIGMTFEQGGHSRGGAAVINEDGDTLTLYDRLIHHYTTGMSTIEVSSKNAAKLVREFKNYFDKARSNPPGEFKAILLKNDGTDRLDRLKTLLDRNQIEWSYVSGGSYTGLNYFSNKTEGVKADRGDVVINMNQPNANMAKVLFERQSKITDSATYDITAWSLPFVFGINAYGLPAYVTATAKELAVPAGPAYIAPTDPTAYAIRWTGLSSAKALAALMQAGVRVRFTEEPFAAAGFTFNRGTLLVTKTSNQSWGNQLEAAVAKATKAAGAEYIALPSGFVDKGYDFGSPQVHILNAPRVTLLAGEGVSSLGMGEIWHFMEKQLKYPVNVVWANDLNKNILRQTDVLVMAEGNYRIINDKGGNESLREWVNNGGKIIALESAAEQLAKNDWGVKIKAIEEGKDDKPGKENLLRKYGERERDFLRNFIPGSIYKVDLDNTHPLAFGYPDFYYTMKQDNTLFDYIKEGGWNVGVVKKDALVAGFVGTYLQPQVKDGMVFGVQDMGRGRVVYLADNLLFRNFWENGKLMFCNALFLVGQ